MKFGRTIKDSLYAEWSDKYLQYSDLKKFIKRRLAASNDQWTDDDEHAFVAELSSELDKVYTFQKEKVRLRPAPAAPLPRCLPTDVSSLSSYWSRCPS